MEKASITTANGTNELYCRMFSAVALQGAYIGGWDLWHGREDLCTTAWMVHSKTDGVYGEVVVSVGPVKAAAGVQQKSSLITVGLVSVWSLKCLVNIS